MIRNRGMFIIAFSLYLFVSAFPSDPIVKRVIRFLYAYALACFYSCRLLSLKQVMFILFIDWFCFVYDYIILRDWLLTTWKSIDESLLKTGISYDIRIDISIIINDLIDTFLGFYLALKINKKLRIPERVGYI